MKQHIRAIYYMYLKYNIDLMKLHFYQHKGYIEVLLNKDPGAAQLQPFSAPPMNVRIFLQTYLMDQ